MANWNLINHTYLHSSKWNFLRQVEDIDIQTAGRGVVGYRRALEILRKEISDRQQKEQQFYSFFNVGSPTQWAEKYLIPEKSKTNLSLQQKILSIINSSEMTSILLNLDKDQKKLKQEFDKFSREGVPEIIDKEIFNKLKSGTAVEELLANVLIGPGGTTSLDKKQRKEKIISQQEALKYFERELNLSGLANKQLLTSRNTDKIKTIIAALNKKSLDINQIITRSGEFLRKKLLEDSNPIDSNTANLIKDQWIQLLKKDLKENKKGLTC